MADLSTLSFWRLFHSLLRHSNGKGETARALEAYEWINDNLTQLRKCCVDYELDLIGGIYDLSRDTETLPTYDIVKERVQNLDKNEGALEALKEYESIRDSQLTVHQVPEMNVVLKDHATTFENLKLASILDRAKRIVTSSIDYKPKGGKSVKLSGAKDCINFIMESIEDGVLVGSTSGVNRPIVVQKEAAEAGVWYDRAKLSGFLPSGLPDIKFMRSNFVGLLGHAGHGKSTLGRFILYTIAAAGHPCLHISIENDQENERNKYVLLHAHNPCFDGEFATLSYADYYKGKLTGMQRSWIDFVADDFEKNIAGKMVIRQPHEQTWDAIRGISETQDRVDEFEAELIDYVQLIDAPGRSTDDRKSKMNAIVKDIRQYALRSGTETKRKVIISPVQGNEEGKKFAQDNEGRWELSGVNNEKELSRSMDVILGIFQMNQYLTPEGPETDMVISSPKARDVGFKPFHMVMSSCGWFKLVGGSNVKIGDSLESVDIGSTL